MLARMYIGAYEGWNSYLLSRFSVFIEPLLECT